MKHPLPYGRRPGQKNAAMRLPVTQLSAVALLALLLVTLAATVGAAEPPSPAQRVYEHGCARCHAPDPGHRGTESLQLKYAGKVPALLTERTDLSPQAVAVFVRQGVLLMAPIRKTGISDAALAALSAYVARRYRPR